MRCVRSVVTVELSIYNAQNSITSTKVGSVPFTAALSQQLRIERHQGLLLRTRNATDSVKRGRQQDRNGRGRTEEYEVLNKHACNVLHHNLAHPFRTLRTLHGALFDGCIKNPARSTDHRKYSHQKVERCLRRLITSQAGLSNRLQSKLEQPKLRPNIPSSPYNDGLRKSKPAVPILARQSPTPPSDVGEDMIEGVKEGDEKRRIKARDKRAVLDRWWKLYRQVTRDSSELFATSKGWTMQHVRDQCDAATLLGKVEYRLRFYPRVDHMLDQCAKVLASVQIELLDLGQEIVRQASERCVQTYIKTMLVPLAQKLQKIEDACRDALATYFYESDGSDIVSGANAISQAADEYKSFNSEEAEIWKGIRVTGNLIVKLLALLRLIRTDTQNPSLALSRKLDAACDIAERMLQYPLSNSLAGRTRLLPWIGGIAHRVREIGLNIRLQKSIPEITFARCWASRTKAEYTWPIRNGISSIKADLVQSIMKGESRYIRQIRSPARQRQFDTLRTVCLQLCVQTEGLLDMFSTLIGNGMTSVCPHPNPGLHHLQICTFRLIDQVDRGWNEIESHMTRADRFTKHVSHFFGSSLSVKELRARRNISDFLETFANTTPNTGPYALSRRRTKEINRNLLVWYSARLLWEGIDATKTYTYVSSCEPSVESNNILNTAYIPEVSLRTKLPTEGRVDENASPPPNTGSMMIDFIISPPTMQQAVTEILQHRVIGIDVIAPNERFNERFSHYITIATKTNIYILDTRALDFEAEYFRFAMKKILADPSIMKICISSRDVASAVWEHFGYDLLGGYDADPPLHVEQFVQLASLDSVLDRFHHGNYDFEDLKTRLPSLQFTDPTTFFHYLALRAFTPLRMFENNQQQRPATPIAGTVPENNDNLLEASSQDNTKVTFSPINIDRVEQYFGRVLSNSLARKETWKGSRKDWMRSISVAVARNTLSESGVKFSVRALRRLKLKGDNNVESKVAAYHMAITFGETLDTIEDCLQITNAAKCILWAAERFGLRLDELDRVRYHEASEAYVLNPRTKAIISPKQMAPWTSQHTVHMRDSRQDSIVSTSEQDEMNVVESGDDENNPWFSPPFQTLPNVEETLIGLSTTIITNVKSVSNAGGEMAKSRAIAHRRARFKKKVNALSTQRKRASDINPDPVLRSAVSEKTSIPIRMVNSEHRVAGSTEQQVAAHKEVEASTSAQPTKRILTQLTAFFAGGWKSRNVQQNQSTDREPVASSTQDKNSAKTETGIASKQDKMREQRRIQRRERRARQRLSQQGLVVK